MDSLVSIIMPVYNSQRHLDHAIDSVLDQTYSNFELLAIENNSSDSSAEKIREYSNRDSRVKFLKCSEQGPAYARNIGIRAARGRFIAFLDSDDMWARSKLEDQLSFMRDNEYALTHTYYERISEEGRFIGEVKCSTAELTYSQLLKSNGIGCLTAIYDTVLLGKRYMPLIEARQDYGLWLAILKEGHSAYCLPKSLAKYRVRSAGSVSSNKLRLVRYNWSLFRQLEGLSLLHSAYCLTWNIYRKLVQ